MTFDDWISENEPEPPTGFECVGVARMRQVWDAAQAAEREACAKECERMMMYPGGRQKAPAHNGVWEAAKAIRMRSNAELSGPTQR